MYIHTYIDIHIYIHTTKSTPNRGILHDGFTNPETFGRGLTGTVVGPDGQGVNLAFAFT